MLCLHYISELDTSQTITYYLRKSNVNDHRNTQCFMKDNFYCQTFTQEKQEDISSQSKENNTSPACFCDLAPEQCIIIQPNFVRKCTNKIFSGIFQQKMSVKIISMFILCEISKKEFCGAFFLEQLPLACFVTLLLHLLTLFPFPVVTSTFSFIKFFRNRSARTLYFVFF